jgi:predicted HTH transcriptional regulator
MTYRDIDTLLEENEGFTLEFKRKVSSPKKIARTLIGFANTKGGVVLFGVDDDKSVVGVGSEKEEIEMIRTAGEFYCEPPIEPDIDIVPYRGKDVIVVRVGESTEKPHELTRDEDDADETKVYIRVNDKTVVASKEVVRILRAEHPDSPPVRISIGDAERRLFDFLEGSERITVRQYSQLINVSARRASRSLIQLVRAGVLRVHTHEKEDFFTKAFDE